MLTRTDIKLLRAAEAGDTHATETLLDQGLDVNTKNCAGITPLHFAADAGQLNCVKLLLSRGAEINMKTNIGLTPLMLAARDGYIDVVKALIGAGADVNMRTQINPVLKTYSGCSALMLATQQVVIMTLKQAGAEEDALTP